MGLSFIIYNAGVYFGRSIALLGQDKKRGYSTPIANRKR